MDEINDKDLKVIKEDPDLWYKCLKECDALILRQFQMMQPGEKINVDEYLVQVLEHGVKRALYLTDEEIQEIKKNKNDIRIMVGRAAIAQMWV